VVVWGYFDYFYESVGDFHWHTKQEVNALYMFGFFTYWTTVLTFLSILTVTLKIYKDELGLMAIVKDWEWTMFETDARACRLWHPNFDSRSGHLELSRVTVTCLTRWEVNITLEGSRWIWSILHVERAVLCHRLVSFWFLLNIVNSFNPSNAILDFGQCRLLNLITYFGTNLKKHCSAC
jgi:hypothetical protein